MTRPFTFTRPSAIQALVVAREAIPARDRTRSSVTRGLVTAGCRSPTTVVPYVAPRDGRSRRDRRGTGCRDWKRRSVLEVSPHGSTDSYSPPPDSGEAFSTQVFERWHRDRLSQSQLLPRLR